MSAPLKVLLVTPFPPPPGGIGRWAVQIAQAGARRPGDVSIICLDISPRWRAVYDLALWKRVIGGGLQMLRDVLRYLWMQRCRPDVVHLNSHGQLAPFRDIPILAVCRLRHIPSVYHMRFGRIPEIARENTVEWRRLRIALRLAQTVIAIDGKTHQTLQVAFPGKRLCLLPNCVTVPAMTKGYPSNPSRPYLIFLGHVIPTKGINELMTAWSGMDTQSWRLLLVGTVDDAYRKELQHLFPVPTVEFLGEQSHERALELLDASEGLVLPSYTEGFPNVVSEAMAMGKAVIATDVGAIPDMLADGCGVVVPPRDADALRVALETTLADTVHRRAMGERGRSKAISKYSVEAVFDQLLGIWQGSVPESP
ncbi:MAG: glycosyltransferase family 4 protein [bacterium]